MSQARFLGTTNFSRVAAAVAATLLLGFTGVVPAFADDDEYERGPKVKVDDDGKEYKYEYEDGRCKYKYELKYRTGEEKVEKKGDCRGVGPHRAVYYSDVVRDRRGAHDSDWDDEEDDRHERNDDRDPYGPAGWLSCHREVIGQVLGGVAGGVLGAQVGDGSGRHAATIAGTIVGAMIGGNIGRRMDRSDTACAFQAFEFAEAGQTVFWRNPNSQIEYRITPDRLVRRTGGRHCRNYRAAASGAGVEEGNTVGTGCRRSDGSWEVVPR